MSRPAVLLEAMDAVVGGAERLVLSRDHHDEIRAFMLTHGPDVPDPLPSLFGVPVEVMPEPLLIRGARAVTRATLPDEPEPPERPVARDTAEACRRSAQIAGLVTLVRHLGADEFTIRCAMGLAPTGPKLVTVELRCPNDDCDAIDVDQPSPGFQIPIRYRWDAQAIEDRDGSVRVVAARYCQECGTEGEVQ